MSQTRRQAPAVAAASGSSFRSCSGAGWSWSHAARMNCYCYLIVALATVSIATATGEAASAAAPAAPAAPEKSSCKEPATPKIRSDSLALKMAEKNLIKALLSEYDKKSRPVIDDDPADGGTPKIDRPKEKGNNVSTIPIQQVTVEFGLRLVQILDLDEMEQVLTTSMIALYEWTDYHLRWDPKNESGIEVLLPTQPINASLYVPNVKVLLC